MHRNQGGRSWQAKAVTFAAACLVGGALGGLALGAAGSVLTLEARAAIGSLLGLTALAVGAGELMGRRSPLIQCDRETPQLWVHLGPFRWSVLNGLTLGCGATSRIGFWLWYAVPLGAFMFGNPLQGALLYGAYGAARGAAPGAVLVYAARRRGWDYGIWLIGHASLARRAAAAQLVTLGVVVAMVVGL